MVSDMSAIASCISFLGAIVLSALGIFLALSCLLGVVVWVMSCANVVKNIKDKNVYFLNFVCFAVTSCAVLVTVCFWSNLGDNLRILIDK